ncbi:MAG TPA: RtcB family protein [Prevotella sp.]|nr:RtcB family protein [Prevotella sp.]
MKQKFVPTHRLDDVRVSVSNPSGLDITLFANKDVPIDRNSLWETQAIASISETISELGSDFFGDCGAVLRRAVLTPDFHKGSGIPVGTVLDAKGFVIPKCVGRDLNCAMRMIATDVSIDEFQSLGKALDNKLRHIYFEGGRDIPLDEDNRRNMLRHGLMGIDSKSKEGLWKYIPDDLTSQCDYTHNLGSWDTDDTWMFEDFIKGSGGKSRDAALGSIGGGNHFVEFQMVEDIMDKQAAYQWGIKKDCISIMIHSGSLSLGSMVGDHFVDVAKKLYPSHIVRPNHDFYPLPLYGDKGHIGRQYLSALGLASNFAVMNRLMLGYMAIKALSELLGRDVESNLIYDLSHNMIFPHDDGIIHRKGSSPAECDNHNSIFPDGHPVIIPGSMGDASYVLKGQGNHDSLQSAPHGAGRVTARGEGRKADMGELDKIRIVTKVDPDKIRPDIANEIRKNMMEEAPGNYKPVLPALETVRDANIAKPVSKMWPLLTIKG